MKYNVILADPPWSFKTWSDKGKGWSADNHYNVMSIDDIKALPVPAADNCALFLWVTFPLLREGLEVMEAWGFDYRTQGFTWVKQNKKSDSLFWGMGYYTRANAELCLLGVKGRMPVEDRGVHSVIWSPVREHSRKPDEQYERIERLYPGANYLEMFARYKRDGWDSWGNEVDSDIAL